MARPTAALNSASLAALALPVLVLVVGAGIGLVGSRNLAASAQAMALERLQDHAKNAERLIGAIDAIAHDVGARIAEEASAHGTRPPHAWLPIMQNLLAGRPFLRELAIAHADGTRISVQRGPDGHLVLTGPEGSRTARWRVEGTTLQELGASSVQVALDAEAVAVLAGAAATWSDPELRAGEVHPDITFTMPLPGPQPVTTVIQVRVSSDDVSRAMERLLGKAGRVIIHDDAGRLLAVSGIPDAGVVVPSLTRIADGAVAAYVNSTTGGDALVTTSTGEPWLVYRHSIGGGGKRPWHFAAMMPLEPLLAGSRSHLSRTVIVTTVLSLLAAVLATALARSLLKAGTRIAKAQDEAAQARAEAEALGSYRLEAKLGAGGMGEVWRATHLLLARPTAVKLIKREAGETERPDAALRFEREARLTASLNSSHTVTVYDFGQLHDGTIYYAMELLDGRDLDVILREAGMLPQEAVVHILIQACDSLAEAHGKGLVHRDLKPANLFIAHQGNRRDVLKILDFGLVAVTGKRRNGVARLTEQGFVQGTPGFMAPEQLRDEDLDGRTDLYALGCVAFWLLTGRAVFPAENLMAELQRHLDEDPPAPSSVTTNPVAPALDRIVVELLARSRTERIASAEALLERLRTCGVAPNFPLTLLGKPKTDLAISPNDVASSAGIQVRIKR